jgi:Flp pilus assembly protein TadB
VSKERARRRVERLAVLEKQKAVRARRSAWRQRRRTLARSLKPGRLPSSGRLYRRSRAQRTGIVVVPLVAALIVWFLVPELGLRLLLIAIIVLVVPPLVVVLLGRRS